MLVAAAFIPSAPLLLPSLGGGPPELRAACQQAISVLDAAERVVVVGAACPPGWHTGRADATPWGARGEPAGDALPLPLAIGTSLLGNRPHALLGVTGTTDPPATGPTTGLLVLADGTAMRTEKAPGHFDERAEGFDLAVERAIRVGDLAALQALDVELAAALLVHGLPGWRACSIMAEREVHPGGAAPNGWVGDILYAGAPFGVGYLVATWLPRGSAPTRAFRCR